MWTPFRHALRTASPKSAGTFDGQHPYTSFMLLPGIVFAALGAGFFYAPGEVGRLTPEPLWFVGRMFVNLLFTLSLQGLFGMLILGRWQRSRTADSFDR